VCSAPERAGGRLHDGAFAAAERRARSAVLRDANDRAERDRHPVKRAVRADEELDGAAGVGRESLRIAVEPVACPVHAHA